MVITFSHRLSNNFKTKPLSEFNKKTMELFKHENVSLLSCENMAVMQELLYLWESF